MSFDRERLADLLRAVAQDGEGGADEALPRASRRDQGAFFTPLPLVRLVVEHAVAALASRGIEWRSDGTPRLRILDPAAGDGRFLRAAAAAVAARCPVHLLASLGADAIGERALGRCVALERNRTFAALCTERLPGAEVRPVEALVGAPDVGAFDLVVGNPPYVRSIRLGETDAALRDALRGRYAATSYGEWDLYTAFIEQTVSWLAPGGEAALVVPSRYLTARSARELRRRLAADRSVRGIIEFGAHQLFTGATTYASALFLSATPQPSVEVARLRPSGFEIGAIDASSLDESPWRISVGRGRALVDAAREAGPPLGQLARIAKGTGTNADRVYVLERDAEPDIEIEEALLQPCYRGRDIVAYGGAQHAIRAIVPYDRTGTFIGPEAMRTRYPRAAEHFDRHRERLEARERGRFRGDSFYQFGRPQNLALLLGGRDMVLVPDVAREGRALVARGGALVLDSAYAIFAADPEQASLLLAILNSAMVGLWLRETGIPLRGDYIRMKTAYLESLPVPDPSGAPARAIVAAVERADDPQVIDDLVRAAYDIGASDWNARG